MSIAGQPMSIFWRFGLLAVVLAGLSSIAIRLAGPDSAVASFVLPIFFVLFQLPYTLVAMPTGGQGIFRPLFFGSPWLVIPFWGLLVFFWNGSVAALISFAYARLTKRV
jgi:hypothetical protein